MARARSERAGLEAEEAEAAPEEEGVGERGVLSLAKSGRMLSFVMLFSCVRGDAGARGEGESAACCARACSRYARRSEAGEEERGAVSVRGGVCVCAGEAVPCWDGETGDGTDEGTRVSRVRGVAHDSRDRGGEWSDSDVDTEADAEAAAEEDAEMGGGDVV
jgi:hypothetical protein